jgi:hypothetical protein
MAFSNVSLTEGATMGERPGMTLRGVQENNQKPIYSWAAHALCTEIGMQDRGIFVVFRVPEHPQNPVKAMCDRQ